MHKVLSAFLIMLFGITTAFAADCAKLKSAYEAKMAEFKKIQKDMSEPTISKAKYDELNKKYGPTYKEAMKLKKQWKQCEEGEKHKHKKFFNEGISLKKQKDYKGALAKFEMALKEQADFQDALKNAAFMAVELKDNTKFKGFVSKIKSSKDKGIVYFYQAKKLKKTSVNGAIAAYKEMAKYYNKDKAYYQIGSLYLIKKSDYKNAVKYYKMAIKSKKKANYYNALGTALMEYAGSKLVKTKPEKDRLRKEAISTFLKGEKFGPKGFKKYSELCARLAQAYNEVKQKGNTKKALKYALKSIETSKRKNGFAYLQQGRALFKLKKYDEAKKAFNKASADIITKSESRAWIAKVDAELEKK